MPRLRIKNGPAQGKTYELTKEVTRLGRESDVQVLDTAASREHAEIFAIGDMFFVRDLGSRNGTLLNEEQLPPQDQSLLRMGDLIRIGSTEIVFEEALPKPADAPEFTTEEEDLGATVELSLEAGKLGDASQGAADAGLHFSVLYHMAKAISSAFGERGLMEKLCEITLQATPAEAVYVFVRDEGKLVPRAHKRRAEKSELKISSTIVKRAIQHNRAILVSDASSDSRFSASSSVVMKGIQSVICAPLLAHDRVAGVIYLHSSTIEHVFTDDHLRLVTALALQAAVAMEAIRAQEEARQQLLSVFHTLIGAHEGASQTAHAGHSERVYACAQSICKALEVPAAEAHKVELAALLHQIGKIGAPEGAFERAEQRYEFATTGAEMLRHIEGLSEVAAAVEAHLERLDGSGGPRKLVGHQVPRAARIVGLADEFTRRLEAAGEGPKRSGAIKRILMSLHDEVGNDRYDADIFNALVVALRTGALKLS